MRKSLKNRLILAFIGLAVTPLFITGLIVTLYNNDILRRQAIETQKLTSRNIAVQVKEYVGALVGQLEMMAVVRGFDQMSTDEIRRYLSEMLYYGNHFQNLQIVSEDGMQQAVLDRVKVLGGSDLKNISDTPEFRQTIINGKKYYGKARISENTGEIFLKIGVPVYDVTQSRYTKAIITEVRLAKLWELLSEMERGQKENVYIISEEGRVIAHQNPSYVIGGKTLKNFDFVSGIGEGLHYESAVKGVVEFRLGEQQYYVVAERELYDAIKLVFESIYMIMFLIVLASSFAVVISVVTIGSIVKPLKNLTDAAQWIEKGDFSKRASEKGPEEVAELAKSFNTMTDKVQSLVSGLESEIKNKEKIQQELNVTNERLNLALESSNLGVWEFYPQQNKVVYSDSWFTMLGYDPQEMEHTFDTWVKLMHPDDIESASKAAFSYFNNEAEELNTTFRMLHKDKSYRWIAAIGKIIDRDQDGKVIRGVGTHLDVTDRKNFEEKLKKINMDLERRVQEETEQRLSNERLLMQQSKLAAMGDMLGSIAHQWRQPLNALGMTVQNIEDSFSRQVLTSEMLEKDVEICMDLVGHMSVTIDDFTKFFKPDKVKTPFSVENAVKEVAVMLKGQFASHSIEVEIKVGQEDAEGGGKIISDDTVKGYPNEFKHVILNLLNNAKDAFVDNSIESERKIEIFICKADGESLCVTVKDNAGGIPEHVASRIFEPYFSTKQEGKGVGIGLYMSKMIIENSMSGTMTFETGEGWTAFVLSFPKNI